MVIAKLLLKAKAHTAGETDRHTHTMEREAYRLIDSQEIRSQTEVERETTM